MTISTTSKAPYSVLFFGTPEFSVPTLRALLASDLFEVKAVITQPDRPAGRGKRPTPSPIKKLALEHGLPVLQPERIKRDTNAFLEELAPFGPIDVNVVIAFGQILPVALLEYPRANSVNIHASLLPRWRGAAPIHRAIMAGDKETGVCLMDMEAGLDTGGVYASATFPLNDTTTTAEAHDAMAASGAELLVANLENIILGNLMLTPQPEDGVTYAEKVLKHEGEIQWMKSADELRRQIHGLNPFPGAFTSLGGQRLKVFTVDVGAPRARQEDTTPGVITAVDREKIEVACGDGNVLILKELQLAGKRKMPARDFLKGVSLSPGDSLGS